MMRTRTGMSLILDGYFGKGNPLRPVQLNYEPVYQVGGKRLLKRLEMALRVMHVWRNW